MLFFVIGLNSRLNLAVLYPACLIYSFILHFWQSNPEYQFEKMLPEQQLCKIVQVIPPDRPGMTSGIFTVGIFNPEFIEF